MRPYYWCAKCLRPVDLKQIFRERMAGGWCPHCRTPHVVERRSTRPGPWKVAR